MRNFEERKAEIIRRSEEIIKERARTRRTAIAACASFAVCVTVFSAVLLPELMTKNGSLPENSTADTANINNAVQENELASVGDATNADNTKDDTASSATRSESASLASRYRLTEISASDGDVTSYRRIEDADDIVQLWQMLDSCKELASQISSDRRGDDEAEAEDNVSDKAKTERSYTVVFTTHEGTVEVYTLVGNILTYRDEETFVLDDAVLSALTAAFDGKN